MPKFNLGGAASGGLTGASLGAGFGAPGALIGGALGAGIGGFAGGDSKDKFKKLPSPFSKEQEKLHQGYLQGAGQLQPEYFELLRSLLSGDPEALKAYTAPYERAFQEQTVPTLAERFTGMNAQKSSAFGQALGSAGAKLQEDLAKIRADAQQNALQQYNQIYAYSQQPRIQYQQQAGSPSAFGQFGANYLSQPGATDPLMALLKDKFGGGGGYQAKYPLTNQYATLFQTGAMT